MADEGAEQWWLAMESIATNRENETLHKTGENSNDVGQVVEEETVELEFEKVKPKLATHSMHCPNCKSEITKVILRRKVFLHRPTKDLVRCFSCSSLFTCSDDGCFNPFNIFRKRSSDGEQKQKLAAHENESCFSMFVNRESVISSEQVQAPEYVNVTGNNLILEDPQLQAEPLYVNRQSIISFGQVEDSKHVKGNDLKLKDPELLEPLCVNRQSIISSHQVQPPKYVTKTASINQGTYQIFSSDIPESSNAREDDDTTIITENKSEHIPVTRSRGRSWLGYEGIVAEILKSIVYGGLMEVIASLSVVVSASASNVTTLSIVSLALASLIGGIFIIGHSLWDLREDCYKNRSDQEINIATTKKYKELLGQVNNFPLHVFIAILSFLVFGAVPPFTYRYSYHETKDKDYALVLVAAVSVICVTLLAMIKAYVNKCTVFDYFKTVMYYIIIAVSVSGVSYVVGNLFERLLEEHGWFNTSSSGGTPCLPRITNPYLESF